MRSPFLGSRMFGPLALAAALAFGGTISCGASGSPVHTGNGDNGGDTGGSGGDNGGGNGGNGGSSTGGKGGSGGGNNGGNGGNGGSGGDNGGGTGGGNGGAGGDNGGGSGGNGGGGAGGDNGGGTGGGGTGGDNGGGTGGGGAGGTGGGTGGTMGGAPLTGDGCAGGTCLNAACKPLNGAMPVGNFPELGFEMQPSYIPNDVVIPTFDDAPDGPISATDPADAPDYMTYGTGEWTKQLIAFFDANNMHQDFFINANNWCGPVLQSPECMATLTSLLKTQDPANHTVHHPHMGGTTMFDPMDLSSASCNLKPASPTNLNCDDEMKGVEDVVNMLSNGGRPHLTRFRAPYGEPFQTMLSGYTEMQGLVKKYAVHVGWNFDSGDSICNNGAPPCVTAQDIAGHITGFLGNAPGQGTGWGVILMHGDFPWTYNAVKMLFGKGGWLQQHKFRVGTVEDAICWKYGKHSWDIIKQLNAGSQVGPN